MRNQLRAAAYSFAAASVGAGGVILGAYGRERFGETAAVIVGVVSLPVAVISSVVLLMSLFAALGHARLARGKGVVAHWHVTAADWDRFRAFDAARSAKHPALVSELRIRERTPAEGVEVIVGRRQVIVDGSYHALSGLPFMSGVLWLPAPVDPECLEFALVYPAGRYGGARRLSLRVPVPASSRADGIRVYWHYHAMMPKPRLGLVFRRPRLVFGWCITVVVVAAAVGGAATFMSQQGPSSDLIEGLAILGIMTSITALIVTLILALIVWTRESRSSPDA
jgi:hypothetical protein